jgi:hypothetical protein
VPERRISVSCVIAILYWQSSQLLLGAAVCDSGIGRSFPTREDVLALASYRVHIGFSVACSWLSTGERVIRFATNLGVAAGGVRPWMLLAKLHRSGRPRASVPGSSRGPTRTTSTTVP